MKEMKSILEFMALDSYERWYKEKVSPYLDDGTKLRVARRISDLSLSNPIWLPQQKYPLSMFPELMPFTSLEEFSGMMLYVTLTEIMKERGYPTVSASTIALKECRRA